MPSNLLALSLPLTLALCSLSDAQAQNTQRWRVHVGVANELLRGALLQMRDGVPAKVGYDDAFARSDRQFLGLSYGFNAHHELSLSMGLDRAKGKTVSLGVVNGLTQAAVLSNFEALRYELGYRYHFAQPGQSGFYWGAQLGRERHNAVNARLADGRVLALFERSSGFSYGLSAGYQWLLGKQAALGLEVAPTFRPGLEKNRVGASSLGITGASDTKRARSLPINLRFSYSF